MDSENTLQNFGIDVALLEEKVTAKPKRYKVLLLNDNYTPMDFVVEVLERFFAMSQQHAVEVMWRVHTHNHAICGVYPHDIAETKVMQVSRFAKSHQYPLLCLMEAE